MSGPNLSDFDLAAEKVGEDAELQGQKVAMDAQKSVLGGVDFSVVAPSSLMTEVETAVEEVTAEVVAGDLCNAKFLPDMSSATSLFMDAITNPLAAGLDALQGLMDDVGFKPPGLGIPKINFDLGLDLPDLKLPSFDLKLGSGGGLDIGSMLSSLGGLLQLPSIKGCDALLPDIGPGAALIAGALPGGIKEGVSGGLVNPSAALGAKKFKTEYDVYGNPHKVVISEGVNATIPRVSVRHQANPPPQATYDYPAYKGNTQANDGTVPPSYIYPANPPSNITTEIEDPAFEEQVSEQRQLGYGADPEKAAAFREYMNERKRLRKEKADMIAEEDARLMAGL